MNRTTKNDQIYMPQYLAKFSKIIEMHDHDPYNNAQSYIQATVNFCDELGVLVTRCGDFDALKKEIIELTKERQILVSRVKSEIPGF